METSYPTLAGETIILRPADVIFVRYHGEHGNWWREHLHRIITWIPGTPGKRHAGYAHVAGVGPMADPSLIISAELRGVRCLPLQTWETDDYSLMICRPPVMPEQRNSGWAGPEFDQAFDRSIEAARIAMRRRVADALQAQVGIPYGRFGVAAQGLDMLLSFGGRLWSKRPISWVVSRLERASYCSEAVAIAFWSGWEFKFRRWDKLRSVLNCHIVQPKDMEWTAALLEWEVVYRTSHGTPAPLEHDGWITNRIKLLKVRHGEKALVSTADDVGGPVVAG